MATNDATPRERIARAMTSDFSQKVWDGEFNPSTDPAYNRVVRDHVRADFLEDADAVIAYLWRSADDPGVMRQVADELNFYLLPDDGTSGKATQAAITTLLTALIGPRPQGENE